MPEFFPRLFTCTGSLVTPEFKEELDRGVHVLSLGGYSALTYFGIIRSLTHKKLKNKTLQPII
jgi:hypothetical protein